MVHRYTDKEYQMLLDNIVILVDTREQNNKHITDWFDKNNIKWESKKLHTGDYNFKITKNDSLCRDVYFTDMVIIERKGSIDELAENITDKSGRFLRELGRFINVDNCNLIIENDTLDDIFYGNFNSKINKTALMRTMLTLRQRHNFHVDFISKDNIAEYIYELCLNTLNQNILRG